MNQKRTSYLLLLVLVFSFALTNLNAQKRAALIKENVAIFYPDNFVPEKSFPSFALLKEPEEIGSLPAAWKTKVEFSSVFGKNLAYIKIDEYTDLYGTGEVTGQLIRNGSGEKTVEL